MLVYTLVFIGAPSLLFSSNGMSQDAQPDGASSILACATFSGVGQGGGVYLEGSFKARCPGGQSFRVVKVARVARVSV